MNEKVYFISLVGPFQGKCLRVIGPSEEAVRFYARDYLGKIWFTIYEEMPLELRLIGRNVYVDERGNPE